MKQSAAAPLHRVLGLVHVTAGGVGIIIGAGIYVLVGSATSEAGGGVWMSFVLAALVSFLTALSYMELASMFPSAAGEYEYTRHAYPEYVAFLVGWVMVSGLMVAAAAVALGFARYVTQFVDLDTRLSALGLLLLVTGIALTGIRHSARLTVLLSLVQVGGLVLVIGIGIPHLGNENLLAVESPGGLLGGAALVFFAFIGFDEVITLAEETEDPVKTVPRGLFLALLISTILYVGVAIAAVSVVGAQALGSSERPLADVIGHALGGRSGDVMASLAIVSTVNTTLLVVTAASRLLYGMASQGSMPAALARVSPNRRVPSNAVVLSALVAAGFVLIRDIALVASVTDFAVYVVFLAVNSSVLLLRIRRPLAERPYRIPGALGRLPVIPLLGLVSVVLMMTQLQAKATLLGIALVGIGLLASFVVRKRPVAT
ncbi:MAG TPA: APC family permease [Dehalococcoidia bacterium]|nr:APC family permease [Dehalococcoidia bacterium]